MKNKPRKWLSLFIVMTFICTVAFSFSSPASAFKANVKPAAAKMVISQCKYQKGKMNLKWKKAKNAKKYEVYYSSKYKGKYKKITSTKKLAVSKKLRGDYYFKVRALNGRKKGKWSKPVHLYSATGKIDDRMDISTNIMGMYTISSTTLWIKVKNESNKSMNFAKSDDNYKIVIVNTKTGKTENEYSPSYFSDDSCTIAKNKSEIFLLRTKRLPGWQTLIDEQQDVFVKCKFKAGGKSFWITVPALQYSTVNAISK